MALRIGRASLPNLEWTHEPELKTLPGDVWLALYHALREQANYDLNVVALNPQQNPVDNTEKIYYLFNRVVVPVFYQKKFVGGWT